MKATHLKYLALLDALDATNGSRPQAELARAADITPSLVNRYLKRLAQWGALDASDGTRKYTISEKGRSLLRRASWQFLSSFADLLERHHARTIKELRAWLPLLATNRVALYGAAPLTRFVRDWAAEAGFEIVGVCDEEHGSCSGHKTFPTEGLRGAHISAIILCDRDRAEDRVLLRLLERYAPVINLFAVRGHAKPEWKKAE